MGGVGRIQDILPFAFFDQNSLPAKVRKYSLQLTSAAVQHCRGVIYGSDPVVRADLLQIDKHFFVKGNGNGIQCGGKGQLIC